MLGTLRTTLVSSDSSPISSRWDISSEAFARTEICFEISSTASDTTSIHRTLVRYSDIPAAECDH